MGFSNKQELERTNFQLQGGLSGWKSVWLVCKTSIAWHWQMFAETRKRKWKHCRHFGSSNLCQVSYCSLVDQAHLIVTSNGRDILSKHHQTVSTYLAQCCWFNTIACSTSISALFCRSRSSYYIWSYCSISICSFLLTRSSYCTRSPPLPAWLTCADNEAI